ncbi:MAG: hypothetical protein HY318_18815, partial [Armatimonadetes bacterium]|nr:hypothetical protein [Armatimonadota bacterium]
DLNEENLRKILSEDWDPRALDGAVVLLRDALAEVTAEVTFKARVMEEYRALGISLSEDKGAVMRAMSQRFSRSEMQAVYAVIAFAEGIL